MDSQSIVFGALFRLSPAIFRWFERLTNYESLKVVRESDISEPLDLRGYKSFRVVRAWWTDGQLVNLSEEVCDSTHFYRFSDVVLSANRRGGFLRASRQLIVPDNGLNGPSRVYFANTNVGGIVDQVGHHVLASRVGRMEKIRKGIFVGSMAPHNWFHWIIDNLATVFQARFLPSEFDDYPLLVPAPVKNRPNWMAALDIASAGREVVFVDDNQWIQVGDLVRIEAVTRANPRPQRSLYRARVGVLVEPLLDFRQTVITQLALDEALPQRGHRLFIGRKPTEARGYNQEEVFAVARSYGFERVYLEDLSFEDSVRVFREAEIIVGPHGAGWANLLFCHRETRAMLWTWEGEDEDNWYENIAFVAAVTYIQLHVPVIGDPGLDKRRAAYELDLAVFEQGLRSLVGGGAPAIER